MDGRAFVNGCDDVGSVSTFGCSSREEPEQTSLSDVRLVIRQDGQRLDLATEDAGLAENHQMGQITWDVRLPSGLRPGPAALTAAAAKLPVTITE